jgi:hypothetical protein
MLDTTKESSLLKPVEGYIKRKGFCVHGTELPFYQRSVDIYGFSRIKNKTIAIELKLHKWKKAFQQALIYQLCADESYIAMPQKYTSRVNFDLLLEHGIGLISVSEIGRCCKLIEARQSLVVKNDYKNIHIAFLQRLTNE